MSVHQFRPPRSHRGGGGGENRRRLRVICTVLLLILNSFCDTLLIGGVRPVEGAEETEAASSTATLSTVSQLSENPTESSSTTAPSTTTEPPPPASIESLDAAGWYSVMNWPVGLGDEEFLYMMSPRDGDDLNRTELVFDGWSRTDVKDIIRLYSRADKLPKDAQVTMSFQYFIRCSGDQMPVLTVLERAPVKVPESDLCEDHGSWKEFSRILFTTVDEIPDHTDWIRIGARIPREYQDVFLALRRVNLKLSFTAYVPEDEVLTTMATTRLIVKRSLSETSGSSSGSEMPWNSGAMKAHPKGELDTDQAQEGGRQDENRNTEPDREDEPKGDGEEPMKDNHENDDQDEDKPIEETDSPMRGPVKTVSDNDKDHDGDSKRENGSPDGLEEDDVEENKNTTPSGKTSTDSQAANLNGDEVENTQQSRPTTKGTSPTAKEEEEVPNNEDNDEDEGPIPDNKGDADEDNNENGGQNTEKETTTERATEAKIKTTETTTQDTTKATTPAKTKATSGATTPTTTVATIEMTTETKTTPTTKTSENPETILTTSSMSSQTEQMTRTKRFTLVTETATSKTDTAETATSIPSQSPEVTTKRVPLVAKPIGLLCTYGVPDKDCKWISRGPPFMHARGPLPAAMSEAESNFRYTNVTNTSLSVTIQNLREDMDACLTVMYYVPRGMTMSVTADQMRSGSAGEEEEGRQEPYKFFLKSSSRSEGGEIENWEPVKVCASQFMAAVPDDGKLRVNFQLEDSEASGEDDGRLAAIIVDKNISIEAVPTQKYEKKNFIPETMPDKMLSDTKNGWSVVPSGKLAADGNTFSVGDQLIGQSDKRTFTLSSPWIQYVPDKQRLDLTVSVSAEERTRVVVKVVPVDENMRRIDGVEAIPFAQSKLPTAEFKIPAEGSQKDSMMVTIKTDVISLGPNVAPGNLYKLHVEMEYEDEASGMTTTEPSGDATTIGGGEAGSRTEVAMSVNHITAQGVRVHLSDPCVSTGKIRRRCDEFYGRCTSEGPVLEPNSDEFFLADQQLKNIEDFECICEEGRERHGRFCQFVDFCSKSVAAMRFLNTTTENILDNEPPRNKPITGKERCEQNKPQSLCGRVNKEISLDEVKNLEAQLVDSTDGLLWSSTNGEAVSYEALTHCDCGDDFYPSDPYGDRCIEVSACDKVWCDTSEGLVCHLEKKACVCDTANFWRETSTDRTTTEATTDSSIEPPKCVKKTPCELVAITEACGGRAADVCRDFAGVADSNMGVTCKCNGTRIFDTEKNKCIEPRCAPDEMWQEGKCVKYCHQVVFNEGESSVPMTAEMMDPPNGLMCPQPVCVQNTDANGEPSGAGEAEGEGEPPQGEAEPPITPTAQIASTNEQVENETTTGTSGTTEETPEATMTTSATDESTTESGPSGGTSDASDNSETTTNTDATTDPPETPTTPTTMSTPESVPNVPSTTSSSASRSTLKCGSCPKGYRPKTEGPYKGFCERINFCDPKSGMLEKATRAGALCVNDYETNQARLDCPLGLIWSEEARKCLNMCDTNFAGNNHTTCLLHNRDCRVVPRLAPGLRTTTLETYETKCVCRTGYMEEGRECVLQPYQWPLTLRLDANKMLPREKVEATLKDYCRAKYYDPVKGMISVFSDGEVQRLEETLSECAKMNRPAIHHYETTKYIRGEVRRVLRRPQFAGEERETVANVWINSQLVNMRTAEEKCLRVQNGVLECSFIIGTTQVPEPKTSLVKDMANALFMYRSDSSAVSGLKLKKYFGHLGRRLQKRDTTEETTTMMSTMADSAPSPKAPVWDMSQFSNECTSKPVKGNTNLCRITPRLILERASTEEATSEDTPGERPEDSSPTREPRFQAHLTMPCDTEHNPCPGVSWSNCIYTGNQTDRPILNSKYECHCANYTGFTLLKDIKQDQDTSNTVEMCQDINECDDDLPMGGHNCIENAQCVNTIGSFRCNCPQGMKFKTEEQNSCEDTCEGWDCSGNGQCVKTGDMNEIPTCACDESYVGEHCEDWDAGFTRMRTSLIVVAIILGLGFLIAAGLAYYFFKNKDDKMGTNNNNNNNGQSEVDGGRKWFGQSATYDVNEMRFMSSSSNSPTRG